MSDQIHPPRIDADHKPLKSESRTLSFAELTPAALVSVEKLKRVKVSSTLVGWLLTPVRRFANGRRRGASRIKWLAKSLPTTLREGLYAEDSLDVKIGFTSSEDDGYTILIVSNDLSGSGAPKIVFEMARVLVDSGHNVVVLSPSDGVFGSRLHDIGATVIVDHYVLEVSTLLSQLAKISDLVICNTSVTKKVVYRLSPTLPTYWYIHEVAHLNRLFRRNPAIAKMPRGIWAGSELSASIIRPYRSDVHTFPYGLDPIVCERPVDPLEDAKFRISVFGSFEMRKGQDLAISAVASLPAPYKSRVRMKLFGRVLDAGLHRALLDKVSTIPEITICGETRPRSLCSRDADSRCCSGTLARRHITTCFSRRAK